MPIIKTYISTAHLVLYMSKSIGYKKRYLIPELWLFDGTIAEIDFAIRMLLRCVAIKIAVLVIDFEITWSLCIS